MCEIPVFGKQEDGEFEASLGPVIIPKIKHECKKSPPSTKQSNQTTTKDSLLSPNLETSWLSIKHRKAPER